MRLVCVLFTFENNVGQSDLRTDGRTAGFSCTNGCAIARFHCIFVVSTISENSISFHFISFHFPGDTNNWEWVNGERLSNSCEKWGSSWYDDATGEFTFNVQLPSPSYPGEKYLAYQRGLSPFAHWKNSKKYMSLCQMFAWDGWVDMWMGAGGGLKMWVRQRWGWKWRKYTLNEQRSIVLKWRDWSKHVKFWNRISTVRDR